MRILLARHAPSLGQKDAGNYVKFGDMPVDTDPEHEHLISSLNHFLTHYYQDRSLNTPPHVITSQHLRARKTAHGATQGLRTLFAERKIPLSINPLLNEEHFGLMPHVENIRNPVKKTLAKIFTQFAQNIYKNDPFMGKTPMGESPMELYTRTKLFVTDLENKAAHSGTGDFLIISHGATTKGLEMALMGLTHPDIWKALPTPNNCDVHEFTIDDAGNRSLHKIYDGPSGTDLRDNPVNIVDALPVEKRTVTWDTLAAPSYD